MKYHLITFGCQMNKNDSERIASVLKTSGWQETNIPAEADFILLNTCSVRASAENHVFGQMKNFALLKEKNQRLILGATGCMPGRDRDGQLKKKLPMIDLFFPITDLPQLPRWLFEHFPESDSAIDTPEDYWQIQPKYNRNEKNEVRQAYVPISIGCNNYCTFCVVPYSRGFERSRNIADVVSECRNLAQQGCLEVTLLGQNVNTYRPNDRQRVSAHNPFGDSFAALLWEINQIDGLARIHFTAPNPQDMSDEVIQALTLPKQVNFLHLPVQSGSNRILKKMNRRYTREHYLGIIDKVRELRPAMAIGTDIIVGFCSETEKDFMETVDLYLKADFDLSYTAMYSERSGTLAAKLYEDDVPREEKKRRWEYLQDIMEKNVLRKNQKFVGEILPVLMERSEPAISPNNNQLTWLYGKSLEQKLVQVAGEASLVGTIQPVKIVEAKEWILRGVRKQPALKSSARL